MAPLLYWTRDNGSVMSAGTLFPLLNKFALRFKVLNYLLSEFSALAEQKNLY